MGKLLPSVLGVDKAEGMSELETTFLESVSPSMRPVEAVIRELAQSDVTVLLLAERGAGKHATAQRVHDMSPRRAQPLRWFRCSSLIPPELDAAFAIACEPFMAGTIFLEEVADLSPACQLHLRDRLMRATEWGIGSSPRLICGSARDLELEVKTGQLREDLYYGISGVCLRLPPLRQRKEDILLLMNRFLQRYARKYHRAAPRLSAGTQRLFQDYSWPGNLHELEDAARVLVASGDEQLAMGGLRAQLYRVPLEGKDNGISLKAASKAASHEAERELILTALTRTRWNRRRAAKELQISYKALLYKLKQIGQRYGASGGPENI
jgi:two-component system, NtrC family, response regulator AtoC